MIRLIPLLAVFFVLIFSCDTKKAVSTEKISQPLTDSAKVVVAMHSLLEACWQCPAGGNCSKVAPFIVYRGKQEPERAWKTLVDYSKEEDREIVDQACMAIRKRLPEGTKYRIDKFQQERESEGVWNVLTVIPDGKTSEGKTRYLEFAFLKIEGQYALGDLDSYTYR